MLTIHNSTRAGKIFKRTIDILSDIILSVFLLFFFLLVSHPLAIRYAQSVLDTAMRLPTRV